MTSVQEQGSSLAAGTLTIESLDQRVADVMKHVDIVSEGPKSMLRVEREERAFMEDLTFQMDLESVIMNGS